MCAVVIVTHGDDEPSEGQSWGLTGGTDPD